MLERFLKYIADERLFRPEDRVLLGVSGGMDSMLMARLFSESPYTFGIAHCNFGLRGVESDDDEAFVKQEAAKLRVPCFATRFQTHTYAEENKLSTQMAARELRFAWFDMIREENGYAVMALAHHLNDLTETMLINLIRGTGPTGMHSMQPKSGNRVRPLLCFTREEIAGAVRAWGVPYREESSNSSDDYLRNRLRHHVIPLLREENPNLERTFAETARHFSEADQFIEAHMTPYRHLLVQDGTGWRISCRQLQKAPAAGMILFRLLHPFGFRSETIKEILQACSSQPGKQFLSKNHRIIKDREYLYLIPRYDLETAAPDFARLFDATVSNVDDTTLTSDPDTAFLDYDKLQFPLTVRYWEAGDRFQPLGLRGQKKLSDFFVDLKVPRHLKKRIPLLVSGNTIVWVAGYRIAEPYQVTSTTKKVYRISLKFQK